MGDGTDLQLFVSLQFTTTRTDFILFNQQVPGTLGSTYRLKLLALEVPRFVTAKCAALGMPWGGVHLCNAHRAQNHSGLLV